MSEYTTITDCAVGDDSASGKAYACQIDGAYYWVPYSVTRRRSINTRTKNRDSIEVESWWVEKNEIDVGDVGEVT